jgi:hypothetical protein
VTTSSTYKVSLRGLCNPRWVLAACLLVPALAQAQVQQDAQAQLDALRKQEEQAKPEAQRKQEEQAKLDAQTKQQDVQAKQDAANSLPGSSRSTGLSLSPEAPTAPPAPGGRAPSFGAPADPDAWTFRIGGRISGFGQLGVGRSPMVPEPGDSGTTLHTPPLIVGRAPIWAGPGGTLNFQYGSQTITTFVSVEAQLTGAQWQSYYRNEYGPRIRNAYVAVNPAPIGDMRLRFQVGAFPANYGAPGPWGWGVFGPVLAIHGYGGTATANYDATPSTQLYLEYGIAGVPEVDQAYARGTFTDWPETGLSTIVNHAHAGISSNNKYFAKLHLAHADGRDMRTYLSSTMSSAQKGDGTMDVAALELRWVGDPYGQLGITPVYWNFQHALSVHNGIWWGIDWTAGGREMSGKFLGPQSNGTGKIVAVSAEYDFSVKRILLAPQPFDGNGRDLRVALAILPFWTVASADPNYNKTKGFFVGATFEHVLLPWLSTTYQFFGENRDAAMVDVSARWLRGRWADFSGTLGLVLHSNWQSQDRIVLSYSRYFYSKFTDSNPAMPLDREMFTLGGSVAF